MWLQKQVITRVLDKRIKLTNARTKLREDKDDKFTRASSQEWNTYGQRCLRIKLD